MGRPSERAVRASGISPPSRRVARHMTRLRERSAPDGHEEGLLALTRLGYLSAGGLVVLLLFALNTPSLTSFAHAFSAAAMVAAASMLVGVLLGFLFGIPRTLQQDRVVESPAPDTHASAAALAAGGARGVPVYGANTNLEQISDWLTKILVGVGLTQLPQLSAGLERVAGGVANGLGTTAVSLPFAYAVLFYYGIIGFLFGFLWSRIFLPDALRDADLRVLGAVAARAEAATRKVESTLDRLDQQAKSDALALSLTHRQLNPPQDSEPVDPRELARAIKAASAPVKVHVFYQAQEVRRANWKDPAAKPVMERTIPVLRALVDSETTERFHRNHSQLGYALKDRTNPDWAEAERRLTEAIEIRGSPEKGWRLYEFNRAHCRIMLDEPFRRGAPSAPESRTRILDDLRVAWPDNLAKAAITSEEPFTKWLAVNGVSTDALK